MSWCLVKWKQKYMRVKVNTFKEMDESLDVTNLPSRKWFHVAIYVSQNSLDVWINGNMVQSKKLESPPKTKSRKLLYTEQWWI